MGTSVCAVSGKECWQDDSGRWYSSGGFPLQMNAIASLFDSMTLLVTRTEKPVGGGLPLPANATVVCLRHPTGHDFRRKISIIAHLSHYLSTIARHARNADVVHVPPPGDIPLLGIVVGLMLRKRMLVRYCGSWHVTERTTMTNRVTRTIMRQFAGGRNVMLATGAGCVEPAPRMAWVFSTAISSQDLKSVKVNLDRGPNAPPVMTFVGRLDPVKGLINLLEALSILKNNGAQSAPPRLEILGDGPQKEELSELAAKLGCADLVSFRGQCSHTDVLKHLLGSDVLVLPSLSEGFPKARLDAFMCGVPVVTTEVGFGREMVGDNGERGWIVPVNNSQSLAERLHRIFKEPLSWPDLRRRCRSYAEDKTLESWTANIGQLCARQWSTGLQQGKLIFNNGN